MSDNYAPRTFCKPGESGPDVYYMRLEDGQEWCINGEPVKLNHAEALEIDYGADPQSILDRRAKPAPAPAEISAETDTQKRGPGRPPKGREQ